MIMTHNSMLINPLTIITIVSTDGFGSKAVRLLHLAQICESANSKLSYYKLFVILHNARVIRSWYESRI